MLPKNLLPFYTHLAVDPDAPEVTVNLSPFYRDSDKAKEFKYKTDQQGYSLLYQVGAGAQQTVEVFPPYRYTYGVNRLQASTSTNYAFNYPVQSDPVYSQATVGFTDLVSAPESILERACGTTASVSVTGLTNETLYIGNFINEARDVIFTSNPINLNVEGLLFLYVVRSRDGLDVYQPGIDYTFDPAYQSITFSNTIEPHTPIVIEIGVATLDGNYKVITANGTHSLLPAFSYGVAITGAEGTYSEFATQITWTSIIDDSEPNTNYVLALSDESGCKTLTSSDSDNVVIADVNALIHRTTFKDFIDVIRASTPVPLDSEASLSSTIAYEEVEIKSASVAGYNETRSVIFNQAVDNPVALTSTNTQAYSRAGSYENGIYRAGSIRSLPRALGVSEVEDSVLDNNQVPATINPTFSVLVPTDDSGLLGKYELTHDMDLMNPISAAWGLLLAASYKDSDVILLNLKALVYQAKQRGWIKLEDEIYVIDKIVAAGLPIYFSATNTNYQESFKEVGSNAFLGWAACTAVLSLTDDEIKAYYAMQGSDSDFYSELLVTLEALALFVANGVSRVTWYAAHKEDAGVYSYDQPSLSATVYADIFLSYFLALRYNSTVHYVAAKLNYNLSQLPTEYTSAYYQTFTERDYGDVQYPFDLNYSLVDATTLALYSKLKTLSAISLWSTSRGIDTSYVNEAYGECLSELTDYAMLNAIVLTSITNPNQNTLHYLAQSAFDATTYLEDYQPLMEVGSLYAAAFVTAVLLELRRLMPFGIKWFSEDVINNTTTVIGGMLYAESEMYYQASLSLYLIESQRSPLTAKFDKAKDWFNLITGGNTSMSEVLSKRLLQLYFSYDSADLNIYRQLLDDFFGINSTISFKSVPDFLVYDMSSAKINYIPVTPGRGAELTGDISTSLTKEEYYSIVYKFVDNDWVKRRVPGFPVVVENVNEFLVVTEAEYLASPKPYHAIAEGTPDVAILPLANYVMQAEIDLGSASPHLLEWLNDTLLPAGLLVKYTSTTEVLGDG